MKDLLIQVKENILFILTCALISAAIYLAAFLLEKYVIKGKRRVSGTRYITYIAIFGALSGVLMLFEIPLFFIPAFYKFDFSEVPILISSFYLGPVAGVIAELVKIVVKTLLKGTSTAFVGEFASFVVGCSFVLPASVIYHLKKTRKGAIGGAAAGTVTMAAFGSFFNAVYLLPKFAALFGMPLDAIIAMGSEINHAITNISTFVFFAVVPFNLLKGVVISVITFLLYKRIEKYIFKAK